VVLFSHVLLRLGVSATLGGDDRRFLEVSGHIQAALLGRTMGHPVRAVRKAAWNRLYLVGFLYVLAPLLALFLFFLPISGAGYFGLHHGPAFTIYLLLVNLPFGIVTALAARAIIGPEP